MAALNPELPVNTPQSPHSQGTPGRQTPVGGHSNRPIPLNPRAAQELPEDFDEDEDGDGLNEVFRNAPAWLVSTVFHMTLLIALGLLAVTVQMKAIETEVIATTDPTEQLGTQLENPSMLVGDATHVVDGLATEQTITPKDLAPVDDPFAAPPALGEIKLGAGPGREQASSDIQGAPIGLALKGRQIGSKNVLLGKYGGTAETEGAVELGLVWLAKQQKPDGSWSLSGPYTDGVDTENSAAATAMALLAFQGHGDTHREGKYAKVVTRGWTWLLKQQQKDGSFSGGPMSMKSQILYTHAQCTIAVCELYGMTSDSIYRGPAERAVAYAVFAQDKKRGGWRYDPGQDSDTSVTGWFVMALQSARMAGLKVPDETLERISQYLNSVQMQDGRQYIYWLNESSTPAMSAEGLLCRQYLGWAQGDPRLVEGVTALTKTPISYAIGSEQDVYYWYYATQATHHMEGKIWEDWNKVLRQQVPAKQVKSGPEAGSWDSRGDKWGRVAGRLYVTCLSIYNLEVYYRHLPIYSGYRSPVVAPAAAADQATEAVDKPAVEGDEKKAPADGEEAAADKTPNGKR